MRSLGQTPVLNVSEIQTVYLTYQRHKTNQCSASVNTRWFSSGMLLTYFCHQILVNSTFNAYGNVLFLSTKDCIDFLPVRKIRSKPVRGFLYCAVKPSYRRKISRLTYRSISSNSWPTFNCLLSKPTPWANQIGPIYSI